ILASGDEAAITKLEQARRLVEEAKDLLGQGEYEAADKKLNLALSLVDGEARRLSVSDIKTKQAKEAFERRRHTVDVFLAAFERVKESEKDDSAKTQANLIRKLAAEADQYAANMKYEEGVAILDKAYEVARSDIREAREGKTLFRSLEFDTPREAYEYELGRSKSHFLLLQYAIDEKNPQGSILSAIEKQRADANVKYEAALKKADEQKYVEAIADLEASTELLLKGIRMTGIYIPG
ncbi:MAG TPA: hypothetical protein VNH64_12220, partial [Parvularculaceae bacterium]|nr:hypothetical protein [Parvularculaceae bacterium]